MNIELSVLIEMLQDRKKFYHDLSMVGLDNLDIINFISHFQTVVIPHEYQPEKQDVIDALNQPELNRDYEDIYFYDESTFDGIIENLQVIDDNL